jgi:DNA invertase Pin-like site-specific DNA recombinase
MPQLAGRVFGGKLPMFHVEHTGNMPLKSPRKTVRGGLVAASEEMAVLSQMGNPGMRFAFVRSQKHEGWSVLPTKYDDGGYSGGTLQRPALERLLADIRDRKVNVVVVYKIDRLTRSLFDFAKIIEVFDAAGVSFVSVTQQFNTITSMGRLTLNVLLSFAQFEREVTGERIRDKIAASKRKGMWMGGRAPLGFEIRDRKLHVVESEGRIIRQLFDLYMQHRNVRVVKEEFDRRRRGTEFGRGSTCSTLAVASEHNQKIC